MSSSYVILATKSQPNLVKFDNEEAFSVQVLLENKKLRDMQYYDKAVLLFVFLFVFVSSLFCILLYTSVHKIRLLVAKLHRKEKADLPPSYEVAILMPPEYTLIETKV